MCFFKIARCTNWVGAREARLDVNMLNKNPINT